VGVVVDLYMKMSPVRHLRQREHSLRKCCASPSSSSGTVKVTDDGVAVVLCLATAPFSAFTLAPSPSPPAEGHGGRRACALPPEKTAAKSGLPNAWK
jgi:hypothetical protein